MIIIMSMMKIEKENSLSSSLQTSASVTYHTTHAQGKKSICHQKRFSGGHFQEGDKGARDILQGIHVISVFFVEMIRGSLSFCERNSLCEGYSVRIQFF